MSGTALHSDLSMPLYPFPGRYPFLLAEQPFVGRENDIQELKQWVKGHSQQDSVMLLIEGKGGVGKTAFVNKLISELNEQSDFCLYGKFHNTPSRVPFMALKQCMHHWLDQLLVLKDEAYENLKQNVKEAVHPHEKVLISVFEELEILFGKKSFIVEEQKQDPQKERQRFTYYFYKLLNAINDSGFRIIHFLDDLQWADLATLHLIHDLLNLYKAPGSLVIGAVRPLAAEKNIGLIKKIRKLKAVKSISLKPLAQNELLNLFPLEWALSEKEQKAFLEYLMHESGGYPFDALQILSFIAHEKLIETTSDGSHKVCWSQLPHFKQDQTVASLIMKEVQGLNLLSFKLLQFASCMGFYFSCERLKNLCQLQHQMFLDGLFSLLSQMDQVEIMDTANNGKQLLDKLRKKPDCDVAVLDMHMDIMDGIETTRQIRQEFPYIKVIGLTMENDPNSIREMLDAGASGYILKNTGKTELEIALERVPAGEFYLSQSVGNQLAREMLHNRQQKSNNKDNSLSLLTEREIEVLKMIAEEMTNQEVAERLFISPKTVETHRKNLMKKIGVNNTLGIYKFAAKHKLI